MEGTLGEGLMDVGAERNKSARPFTDYEKRLLETDHLDTKTNLFSRSLLDDITDEICLEGLDGITIQALKIRLESRPNLELEGFEDVAPAIWNQIKLCKYFKFYLLPKPRPDLVPYRWDMYRDDRGSIYEPLHAPEEIYIYNPIEDKNLGMRGSCQYYKERKDVSDKIRKVRYEDTLKTLGNRLVIVASQVLRENALFGVKHKKYENMQIIQYCIMERVGRARYSGEITRGKISTACLKIPPKTQFYNRKMLLNQGLIVRQSASMKFSNSRCPAIITVFHLPRFYNKLESVSSLNTRVIFACLNQSETKSIPVEAVVSKYGKHTLRNLTSQFSVLLETAWDRGPVADEEINEDNEKKVKYKAVRALRLKVTDVTVQNQVLKKILDGATAGEEDDIGEQDDNEESALGSCVNYSQIQVLRSTQHFTTVTDTWRLHHALLRAGINGLTLLDMAFLNLTNLETRSASRILIRHNACKEGVTKLKKQKAFTYTLSKFTGSAMGLKPLIHEKCTAAIQELKELRESIAAKRAERLRKKLTFKKSGGDKKEQDNVCEAHASTGNVDTLEVEANDTNSKKVVKDSSAPRSSSPSKKPSKRLEEKRPPNKKNKNKKGLSSKAYEPVEKARVIVIAKTEEETIIHNLHPTVVSTPRKIGLPTLCLAGSENLRIHSKEAETTTIRSGTTTSQQVISPVILSTTCQNLSTDPGSLISPDVNNKNTSNDVTAGKEAFTFTDELSTAIPVDEEEMDLDELIGDEEEMGLHQKYRRGDSMDEELRSRMTRQRVDWNAQEDRFILVAFIGSTLFVPKYNFSKVFIFNAFQIRDLMLKKNSKSTKTSLTIRRRIHFLMNQKTYFDRYISLMGAAVRDENLYETGVKMYLRPPQPRVYDCPPNEALENVIDYLNHKFDGSEYENTDTKVTLTGIETLLFLRQFKRCEFYWNAMMFAIFCPMGDTSASRRRFRLFWRKCTSRRRVQSITDSEKSGESSYVTEANKSVPAGSGNASQNTSPNKTGDNVEGSESVGGNMELMEDDKIRLPEDYYLDYCFKFLRFLTKHCKIVFNNLLMMGSSRKKEFELVSFDMNTISSNICFAVRECTSVSEIRLWTARSLVLSLIFSGDPSKILEKSITDLSSLPMEKSAKSLLRARVLVSSKKTGFLGISRLHLRQFAYGLPSYSFDESLDFLDYIDEASHVDSLACISIGILFGIVELTDYFKSSITVTESVFTLNDEWAPIYDGISHDSDTTKKTKKRKGHRTLDAADESPPFKKVRLTEEQEEEIEGIMECFEEMERGYRIQRPQKNVGLEEGEDYMSSSTNALRLLRIRLNEAGVRMPRKQFAGFVEKDFFTVNLPNLEFVFPRRSGLNHRITGRSHPYSGSTTVKEDLRKELVELVYHRVSDVDGATTRVVNMEMFLHKYRVLFEVIDCTGGVGISGAFLKSKFEIKPLSRGLRYLLDARLIFSVGVAHRRFVSYKNIKDWTIPIRPHLGSKSVGHVIMRPWITAFGSLSWSAVNRLLISLIGQLHQKPAILFDELLNVFSPTLSCVEVTVLVEALVKLNYLTIYKFSDESTSLFSKHPKDKFNIEYNTDTLVDTEDVYIAVSPYTTFLYAQLQHALNAASSKQPDAENSKKNERQRRKFGWKRKNVDPS